MHKNANSRNCERQRIQGRAYRIFRISQRFGYTLLPAVLHIVAFRTHTRAPGRALVPCIQTPSGSALPQLLWVGRALANLVVPVALLFN